MASTLKWASLGLLVFQNAATPITFRWATTEAAGDDRFDTATAVTMQELLKFMFSLLLLLQESDYSRQKMTATIKEEVLAVPAENLKLAVPALVYFLQNCALQVSAANLPAAVFQVLYQGKTLAVAFCSVLMLNKKLSRAKWLAITLMGIGIAAVQLGSTSEAKQSQMANNSEQSVQLGLISVVFGCLCSGFAGVYFEKMIKAPSDAVSEKKPPSMWIKNMQLAFFSILIGSAPIITRITKGAMSASGDVATQSILHGFTPTVWMMVLNNVAGGLLVAMVIKYADNILKGFACALATVVATVLSVPLFGFSIGGQFALGVAVVMYSTFLYGGTAKLSNPWWDEIADPTKCLQSEENRQANDALDGL